MFLVVRRDFRHIWPPQGTFFFHSWVVKHTSLKVLAQGHSVETQGKSGECSESLCLYIYSINLTILIQMSSQLKQEGAPLFDKVKVQTCIKYIKYFCAFKCRKCNQQRWNKCIVCLILYPSAAAEKKNPSIRGRVLANFVPRINLRTNWHIK